MDSNPPRFREYKGLENNTNPFDEWFENREREDDDDVDECEEDNYNNRDWN